MRNDIIKKHNSFIVLSLLVLFYAVNNYIWFRLDEFPPYADGAYHLLRALDYFDILSRPSGGMFSALLQVDNLRPPFFPFCTAIAHFFASDIRLAAVITNIFFAAVLFISIYYSGKKIAGKNCGLLAAFTVAMYPYVFGLSRISIPDFASLAMTSLGLCLLIYTDRFKNTLFSVLLGIAIGIGILTALTFVFFLAGPMIIMAAYALIEKKEAGSKKRAFRNLCLAAVIAALIGGVWYFPKFGSLWETYIIYGFKVRKPLSPPETFSLLSFTYYFRLLSGSQIAPFFTIMFFIGLASFLNSKDRLSLPVVLWIIVTYAIFTLINNKHPRADCSYLPIFALVTAAGVSKLRTKWFRNSATYAIILAGSFQFLIISYVPVARTNIRLSFFSGRVIKGMTVPSHLCPISGVFFHHPRKGDWRLDDVMSAIEGSGPKSSDATIGITDIYTETRTDWYDPFNLPEIYRENFVATNTDAVIYFIRSNKLGYRLVSLSLTGEKWKEGPLLDFIVSIMPLEELAPLIYRQYALILETEI
ncbi:MAG: glycosyltransferase family 39 protein, partial [Candidatus Omnitrophota bacterium]